MRIEQRDERDHEEHQHDAHQIHVIDKVLTPPVDDPFEGIDCAETIGLTTDGYGFTPSVVNIEPGQTVCWSWTDAGMAHNVKQVDGFQSSTYVTGGVTSGDPATTVAFHHTFTENQTFYYACEPHITMGMVGVDSTYTAAEDGGEGRRRRPGRGRRQRQDQLRVGLLEGHPRRAGQDRRRLLLSTRSEVVSVCPFGR